MNTDNQDLPESYRDALLIDPLLRHCVEAGMSYPEIIGELCARHAGLMFQASAAKICDAPSKASTLPQGMGEEAS